MSPLSKSKLISHRQCPKKLWLEVRRPELAEVSGHSQARFDAGHAVGALAQRLYANGDQPVVLDPHADGWEQAFAKTQALLKGSAPFFEAAFRTDAALSLADVMIPAEAPETWKMVEVKSSTSVKDVHRDDAAIQYFVAQRAGARISYMTIAHLDSAWVYQGDGDYDGLLVEVDVTADVAARTSNVEQWIADAHATLREATAPDIRTGKHCSAPYDCAFFNHCSSQELQPTHPIDLLPRVSKKITEFAQENDVTELADVPDRLLNSLQQRVKKAALSGEVFHDHAGAQERLRAHPLPGYFLDFETVNPVIPLWAGTRAYEQIPFQFSCHLQDASGALEHRWYLHDDATDPRTEFARAVIEACDAPSSHAPIFVFNQAFEIGRIRALAKAFPEHAATLDSIVARLVDLLPIARDCYYHPSMKGSFSIKALLPAIVPALSYQHLDGVKDGGGAQAAFAEMIAVETSAERKNTLRKQLLAYCELDTFAMVRVREALLRPNETQRSA